MIGKSDWAPTKSSKKTVKIANIVDDPLVLVDTDLIEDMEKNQKFIYKKMFFERHITHSAANPGEAKICAKHIESLIKSGLVHPALIGCITPYLAQTHEIAKHLCKIFIFKL